MRKVYQLTNTMGFLILLFQAQFLFAQQLPDSCLTDFYPLNEGDYWEYRLMGPPSESLTTQKVTGDTLMGNGITYKVIESFDYGYNYEYFTFLRKDSTTVFMFDQYLNTEYVLYDLGKNIGEFWPTEKPGLCDTTHLGKIEYIRDEEIFGELKTMLEICTYCARDTSLWLCDKLVKGVGTYIVGSEGNYTLLQGAIIKGKQFGIITSIEDRQHITKTTEFSLFNYPNPFNAGTSIKYTIPTPEEISVRIYNLQGRQVKELFSGWQAAGEYLINWDGKNSNRESVASGSYILSVSGRTFSRSKMLTIIK